MGMDTQIDLSKFSRKTLPKEQLENLRKKEQEERLRKVAASLQIREDDALWPLLQALEYQRKFYVELPDKIGYTSREIIGNMREAAQKEAATAQANLTKSVVAEAKYLASKIQWAEVFPMLIMGIIAMFAYSALCMWAGFQLGAREVRPIRDFLLIPWAPLMGLGISLVGVCYLILSFKKFCDSEKYAGWHCLGALAIIIGSFVAVNLLDLAIWQRIFQ